MSGTPEKQAESPADPQGQNSKPPQGDGVGRLLFLVAGGPLLSIMVSCACGPVR